MMYGTRTVIGNACNTIQTTSMTSNAPLLLALLGLGKHLKHTPGSRCKYVEILGINLVQKHIWNELLSKIPELFNTSLTCGKQHTTCH